MFKEIKAAYLELFEALKLKKQAIIKKELETLSKTDETITIIIEKISKLDIINASKDFTDAQKEELRTLGAGIKELQENNEILIKHSLEVINEVLSGILNIAMNEKCSYDSKGFAHTNKESLDISSITEEA